MGGMGINNLPGSQMMLMGRGGGYPVGWRVVGGVYEQDWWVQHQGWYM
jgi:hypothetical protein